MTRKRPDILATETRPCPRCGRKFQSLVMWPSATPCDSCGHLEYAEYLKVVNKNRPYSVSSIGGSFPTQAEGTTADGRPFYFRARHGDWSLEIGGWDDRGRDYLHWRDYNTLASGDDASHGCMTDDAVLAVLDEELARL
jgi:hypothetical protein